MLLQREGVQYRRIIREGNEILRVRYYTATGENAAAMHTAALIRELVGYAEHTLSERLVAEGILQRLPFSRHRYEIDWREEPCARGSAITLTALHARGREVLEARTLVTLWNEEGTLQKALKKQKSPKTV